MVFSLPLCLSYVLSNCFVFCKLTFFTKINFSLSNDMKKIQEWFSATKLTINVNKTAAIIIQPTIKKEECSIDIVIDKERIPIVNSYKYLGINLDNQLNFDIHIENIESKISRSIGSYGSYVRFSIKKTLRIIYYALVHPFLYNGITIWGTIYSSHLQKLILLQNTAIRDLCR